MLFFTSITSNYLPKARVLGKSLKKHHPDAILYVVLSDTLPECFDISQEPFDAILYPQDLSIDNLDAWLFKHSVVELCTAVKGAAFRTLFELTDAEKIVYLDPDIAVLYNLHDIDLQLDTYSIVLTPHQIEAETSLDAIAFNEICSLQHGVYNLGFLGVKRSETGLAFVEWWRERLLHFCYDDIPAGLFTDQRWIDLVPAMFDEVGIIRDDTWNVAPWNFSRRIITRGNDGSYMVNNRPVKFYHFSGFDSGSFAGMLDKYAGNIQAQQTLHAWYQQALVENGQQELGQTPCKYNFYSNGSPIAREHRLLYRSRPDLMAAYPTPAEVRQDGNCYYNWLQIEGAFAKPTREQQWEDKLHAVEQQNRIYEEMIAALYQSKSWRLTRPFRWLARIVR